jgi:pimeloyl-ACP methyl ester carboxylesterase
MTWTFKARNSDPRIMNRGICAPTIIALHCTGATGKAWRSLEQETSGRARVLAPDLQTSGSNAKPASLMEDAQQVIEIIDSIRTPIHLVGHSYGGALALRVALERSHRIASLNLYEPSAFQLFRHMGKAAETAVQEIQKLAYSVKNLVRVHQDEAAMQQFTDYWQGTGSWRALPDATRKTLASLAFRVPHDFAALFSDPMNQRDLRRLRMPCRIISGDLSPLPARLLAQHITCAIPEAHLIEVAGAGHMGPVTHRDRVASIIAREIGVATLSVAA